jgi:hypothetical protein
MASASKRIGEYLAVCIEDRKLFSKWEHKPGICIEGDRRVSAKDNKTPTKTFRPPLIHRICIGIM